MFDDRLHRSVVLRQLPGAPKGNLDPDLTIEIMKLLQQVNARGTTVIIATHDPELLRRFNKRQVVLDRGRVVADH